jgi:Protein of unknown function (DUF3108)
MKPRPDRRSVLRTLLALAAFAAAAAGAQEPGATAAALQPYKARYQVSYRGVSGGQIEAGLRRGPQPGQWLYETRAFPNLLGRVAVSPQARERAVVLVSPSGVKPLTFSFDDGSTTSAKDVRLAFDWTAGRVRGEVEGVPFEMPVPPGTQDTASVQAAMLVDLLAGRTPQGFPILTGRRLREYRYWSEGPATVVTPFGQFETVVWANQRDGSTRLTRVWHAPSLGYLPVQAVQFRKGQPEVQMRLLTLERP